MTIAQKLNDIAKEQGGTPSADGTIASALDALNDALAGSNQPAAQTIEAAVGLLGQHIGGGGTHSIAIDPEVPEGVLAVFEFDPEQQTPSDEPVTALAAGKMGVALANGGQGVEDKAVSVSLGHDGNYLPLNLSISDAGFAFFIMPDRDDVNVSLADA